MEKEAKTNEQQIEELQKVIEELQQQLARYDAYVKQQEITIRMLASMINK